MLADHEIESWDHAIERSGDPTLIRKFYSRTGKPERITEIFRSAVKHFAGHDILLQEKFEQGLYNPELSDDDVKKIAVESLKEDISEKRINEVFQKLNYPVFATAISDDELGDLVNDALREGMQSSGPEKDTVHLIDDLLEWLEDAADNEGSTFAFGILQDEQYRNLADPELVRTIVTVRICQQIVLGRFTNASTIKAQFPDHYDEPMIQYCITSLSTLPEFQKEYGWAYLIVAFRSAFKDLFTAAEDPRISTASKIAAFIDGNEETANADMDAVIDSLDSDTLKKLYSEKKGIPYEKSNEQMGIEKLHHAFDQAEEFCGILVGIRLLTNLLGDDAYVQSVGEDKIRSTVQERIAKALENNNPNIVYSLLHGTALGKDYRSSAVPQLEKYVSLDRAELLQKMIDSIEWNPNELLSNEYDFFWDNLTDDSGDIDNAYHLYITLRDWEQNILPSEEQLKKIVFLKMATRMKETYEGKGIQSILSVYEDPGNAPYIDNNKMKLLLTKVFDEYFEKGRIGGFMHPELITHFYTLISSSLGQLVQDDKRLEPYFKLHAFLESKSEQERVQS